MTLKNPYLPSRKHKKSKLGKYRHGKRIRDANMAEEQDHKPDPRVRFRADFRK